MRIAIVHDCLTVYGGAETFLNQVFKIFPDADLFSVIDFFSEKQRQYIHGKKAETTFIQKLPFAKRLYHYYFPLMPLAIEQLDLRKYDLILSSSYAVAKGVIIAPHQTHICYCHTPLRHVWDMQHSFLEESYAKGIKKALLKWCFHKFRLWDTLSSHRVDAFIANSHFVAKRIQKAYRREATVMHLGIELSRFPYCAEKEDYYLTASRLVPYKKVDLIVDAFAKMPTKKLIVIGEGSEKDKLSKKQRSNITFLGYQNDEVLCHYMQKAKAFIMAAKEDYGLTPLEAQACGTPVIAYGEGGALETVRGLDQKNPTGYFFQEQTLEALMAAIDFFEKNQSQFLSIHCREQAEKFSDTVFSEKFYSFVREFLSASWVSNSKIR